MTAVLSWLRELRPRQIRAARMSHNENKAQVLRFCHEVDVDLAHLVDHVDYSYNDE